MKTQVKRDEIKHDMMLLVCNVLVGFRNVLEAAKVE